MKSRISFFNLTLYKKDITRFAPLWILYTVGTMLMMLSVNGINTYFLGYSYSGYSVAEGYVDTINGMIGPLSILNLLYGILAAQLLFGELFNSRLCNALHAMPVTRETRFGSHFLSGLSFSVVPNLLIAVLMMPDLGGWWYTSLLWMLTMTLQYLCFFGVAVLAMQCTGNRFAAILVYAIINFGSMAALWFANVIFLPLMPGVVLEWEGFAYFSPVVQMCRLEAFFDVQSIGNDIGFVWGDQWSGLWIYAGIGLVAAVGALLLYRSRKLESAGDFMAVKCLKPIFLVLYTLCVGAFSAVFGSIFGGDTYIVFLIVGFAVGFFTGKLLLERTIKIFNLKSLLQLGIIVSLMWLSLMAVQFDVFGIVSYVPKPDAVKEAHIVSYNYGSQKATVSQTEGLEILQKAHQLALEEEGCKHADSQSYEITYYMKDGRTVRREYRLCRQEEASQKLEELFYSPNAIFGYKGHWDDYAHSVTDIKVTGLVRQDSLPQDTWLNFLDQMYYDCTIGALGSQGGTPSRFSVAIYSGTEFVVISIRENSMSCNWLERHEKSDMLAYLKNIKSMALRGKEMEQTVQISQAYYDKLVYGMYADVQEDSYLNWALFKQTQWDPIYELHIEMEDGSSEVLYVGEYAQETYYWVKQIVLSLED